MALKPLNSVGGFSVGENPANVIAPNTYITSNGALFSGNLAISNANANWGILTDNLYYSNGTPWDLQLPGGSNTQIQFNNNGDFGASANFTFNTSTNLLTVAGNTQFNNANLGNLATANFVNVASNTITNNLTVNLEVAGNTANFTGNLSASNLFATNLVRSSQLEANVANGTAPLIVNSQTLVANLNADLLDGYNTATSNTANTVAVRDTNGNLSANYFIGNGAFLTGIDTSLLSNGNSNVK